MIYIEKFLLIDHFHRDLHPYYECKNCIFFWCARLWIGSHILVSNNIWSLIICGWDGLSCNCTILSGSYCSRFVTIRRAANCCYSANILIATTYCTTSCIYAYQIITIISIRRAIVYKRFLLNPFIRKCKKIFMKK